MRGERLDRRFYSIVQKMKCGIYICVCMYVVWHRGNVSFSSIQKKKNGRKGGKIQYNFCGKHRTIFEIVV